MHSTRFVLHLKHAKKVSKIYSANQFIFRTFNNTCPFANLHSPRFQLQNVTSSFKFDADFALETALHQSSKRGDLTTTATDCHLQTNLGKKTPSTVALVIQYCLIDFPSKISTCWDFFAKRARLVAEENPPKKKSLISTDHGDNSSGQPKCASSSGQSHRTLRFHCSIPQIFLLARSFLLDVFFMLELESSKKKGMGGDYTDSSFCTTQE